MNKVFLTGYLAREPEMFSSQRTAMPISRSAIAVRNPSRNEENRTDFFNITAFNTQANFMNTYLHKGNFVILEGHITQNKFINKEGKIIRSTSIIVDSIAIPPSQNKEQNNKHTFDVTNNLNTYSALPINNVFTNNEKPIEEETEDLTAEEDLEKVLNEANNSESNNNEEIIWTDVTE